MAKQPTRPIDPADELFKNSPPHVQKIWKSHKVLRRAKQRSEWKALNRARDDADFGS